VHPQVRAYKLLPRLAKAYAKMTKAIVGAVNDASHCGRDQTRRASWAPGQYQLLLVSEATESDQRVANGDI
jgi:hypothetical protein